MRRRASRILVAAGLIVCGAHLTMNGVLSCGSTAGEAAMSSVDMCFIFDCTGGALGGLIDPCADVPFGGGGSDDGTSTSEDQTGGTFFADCPTEEDEG